MSEKTLINVLLPATRKTYDFRVPSRMRIHDVSELVAQTLEAREEEAFKATGNMLAERESGDLLDGTVTLEEAGIVNGTRLTLM